ncbi:hypothetical protein [Nostoc sp.]
MKPNIFSGRLDFTSLRDAVRVRSTQPTQFMVFDTNTKRIGL